MLYHYIERTLNPATPLPADATEFNAIALARLSTSQALAIEEKYSLILKNYFEFERALHRIALENMLNCVPNWSNYIDEIRDINRVLMNLLTAKKMYVDQLPQHLNRIFAPSESQSKLFVNTTNDEFAKSLGYRILCALRNHGQHGEFPVQSLSLNAEWREDGQIRHCAHAAAVFAHRVDLVQNKRLNAKVRTEVAGMPEEVELTPLVRASMSSFARLHLAVRDSLCEHVKASDSVLNVGYSRFEKHTSRKPIGLYIVHSSKAGIEIESHSLSLEAIEHRTRLETQSATLTNMEQHYVTGRVA